MGIIIFAIHLIDNDSDRGLKVNITAVISLCCSSDVASGCSFE